MPYHGTRTTPPVLRTRTQAPLVGRNALISPLLLALVAAVCLGARGALAQPDATPVATASPSAGPSALSPNPGPTASPGVARGEPTAPTKKSPQGARPAAKPKQDSQVWVGVYADDPRAVLERRPKELAARGDLAGVDGWEAVCIAPCQARLDRLDGLRVAGSGIEPIGIWLPELDGPYTVYAETGSAADQTAGLVLLIAGMSAMVLGGGAALALELGPAQNAEPDSPEVILSNASLTTLIVGGVLFAVSLPFRFASTGEIEVKPGWGPSGPPPAEMREPSVKLGGTVSLTPRGLAF